MERKANHDSMRAGWGEPPPSRYRACVSVRQCNETPFLPFERGSHTTRHQLQKWLPTTRKNSRFLHHSRPICRSCNDTRWCHLLRLAGSSINKPQWKCLVSAVAHLTVPSSASRYLSQTEFSLYRQCSEIPVKDKKCQYVCTLSPTALESV